MSMKEKCQAIISLKQMKWVMKEIMGQASVIPKRL
jgi:hypothetical protein